MVLGRGDEAENATRGELFVVDAEALDGRLDDLLLVAFVVDHEVAGVALAVDLQSLDVSPQHAHAEGVKGTDGGLGKRVLTDELVDALGHLGGGFVGEGDGQDAVGGNVLMLDEIGDAIGDDPGFARSGSGQNEHGATHGFHRFTLLRIELGEKVHERKL